MYNRRFQGQDLEFEASGGLIDNALIMQDTKTDSYWSIMRHKSIAGSMADTALSPIGKSVKTTWGQWKHLHPSTTILEIASRKLIRRDPYQRYFASDKGFRGAETKDQRLESKAGVYGIIRDGTALTLSHNDILGGALFDLAEHSLFAYRSPNAAIQQSSYVYVGPKNSFERGAAGWMLSQGNGLFDPSTGTFKGGTNGTLVKEAFGLDTFWYVWSAYYPETSILKQSPKK